MMMMMMDRDKEHFRSFVLGPRAQTFASQLVEFLDLDDLGSSSAYWWKQGQAVDGGICIYQQVKKTDLPLGDLRNNHPFRLNSWKLETMK